MRLEKQVKKSLTKKSKLLLCLSMFDNLILGWVGVWWVVVFLRILDSDIIPINNALSCLVSVVGMVYVVKHYSKPSFTHLFTVWVTSYLSLFFLFLSYESFMVGCTLMGFGYNSLLTAFNNRLKALNIPDADERNHYDNCYTLVSNGMGFIGALLSYVIMGMGVPVWLMWVVIFVLYDLDMVLKLFLIRRGDLEYSC
jgi:hypothetical protein